jgi:hypothetical protein
VNAPDQWEVDDARRHATTAELRARTADARFEEAAAHVLACATTLDMYAARAGESRPVEVEQARRFLDHQGERWRGLIQERAR